MPTNIYQAGLISKTLDIIIYINTTQLTYIYNNTPTKYFQDQLYFTYNKPYYQPPPSNFLEKNIGEFPVFPKALFNLLKEYTSNKVLDYQIAITSSYPIP